MLVPCNDKLHCSPHRLQQLDSIIVWYPLQRMTVDGDNLVVAFQPSIPWEDWEEGEEGGGGEEGIEGAEMTMLQNSISISVKIESHDVYTQWHSWVSIGTTVSFPIVLDN